MDIYDIFDKGGVVVWILALYSVGALAIVLDRYIHFALMGSANPDIDLLAASAAREMQTGGLVSVKGPEAAIAKQMISAASQGTKDLVRVASRVGSDELVRMEWGLRTMAFFGNTAPLLGLFGTITGMIKAFMVIEQAGGRVDAQALAGGIWEAMLTTGVGLAVGIPTLFLLHLLEGKVDSRAHIMRRVGSIVLENLSCANSSSPDIEEIKPHIEEVMDGV
ncbi:MAG: MotA/TolQ/ExbB proton channel family protein [Nitrospinota bacterium]|nr:MotA/TolQ/ExbB proton channel family protein [Nitrospinota bacterium]